MKQARGVYRAAGAARRLGVSLRWLLFGSLIALVAVGPAYATPFPGPDDFGYSATQIGENLRVIAGPEIVDGDDTLSAALPIGFTFDFYGTDYTEAYVSSNGFLSFVSPAHSGCCSGEALPSDTDLHTLVAGFWTDLCPGCAGTVSYQTIGAAPNREFVVDFDMVDQCCGSPERVDFQIILHEDSDIELQFGQMDPMGRIASVGIEDPTETIGLQIANGDNVTGDLEHRGFLISNLPPPPPPIVYFYDLTVTKAGSGSGSVKSGVSLGIDCGTDCSSSIPMFTYGTLVATPDGGSDFEGWSGPCLDLPQDGPDQCIVQVLGDLSVTATFTDSEPPPPPSVTEHVRTITAAIVGPMKAGARPIVVFRGTLQSMDGFAPCAAGQEVSLQRRLNHVWLDRTTIFTDETGGFEFSRRATPGNYRVLAPAVTLAGDPATDTCLEAASPRLRVLKK